MRIPPVIKSIYSEIKGKLADSEIKHDRALLEKQLQSAALKEDTYGFLNHT